MIKTFKDLRSEMQKRFNELDGKLKEGFGISEASRERVKGLKEAYTAEKDWLKAILGNWPDS